MQEPPLQGKCLEVAEGIFKRFNSFNKAAYEIPHGKWRTFFQRTTSPFTKVQHNIDRVAGWVHIFENGSSNMAQLEMHQETFKLQASFMPQLSPLQAQEQFPNLSAVERIKTWTAS